MKWRTMLTGMAASVMLILGTPGSASAATVTQSDRVGDAKARFDIVRITYANNSTAFSYRMKLRDITRRNGTLVFPKLLVSGTWSGPFYQVTSGARRDGTRFHKLFLNSATEYRRVPCPGMTGSVSFSTDIVTARVPQACLGRLGHRNYRAIGYAATPGMLEAGDIAAARWVNYG